MSRAVGTRAAGGGRRWSLAHLSLEQKLPLLICTLLLGLIVIYAAAAYQTVTSAALAATRERLVSVTDQLAGLLAPALRPRATGLTPRPPHD